MGTERLVIHGAREHNLKNVTLDLPRDELIVFTGLSGSGKSSLAFDTIYAEGQRRYVESLSSYARQFLGQMEKPDVDFIEGLSPAISIDQKSTSRNPRSTVGTITEVYDYLRVLFARVGPPALSQLRAPDRPPDARADRRPGARAARGHPVPGAGAHRPGPQGRVRQAARRAGAQGLPAGAHRRRGPRPRRTHPAAQDLQAHDRGRGRPPGRQARHPPAGRRFGRDRARARRRHRRPSRSRPTTAARSSRPSARSSPAPTTASPSTNSRPATSRSTRRTGRAPRATGSARGSRSTPSSSSPTPTCRSTRARSRPGPAPRSSTGTACSTRWARRTTSISTPRSSGCPRRSARSCCTAPTRRSTSATRTATDVSAPTTPPTRAWSPTSSVATRRPNPTPSATSSSSSCARSRAEPARAPASSPRPSPSRSTGSTSPSSPICRSATPAPSSTPWSCPNASR